MTPKRTRRRYTAEFKAEVALAALTERQPLADLAARYQLATAQTTRWKLQLRAQSAQVFAEAPAVLPAAPDVEPLYAAIGRLQMENALLKKTGSLSNPVNSGGCDQYSHSHVLEIRQSERDALHVAQIIIQAFGYRISYPSIGKCGN